MQQSTGGRQLLPETLCQDFDRIVQAFAQVESRQDDKAKETLQGIGLRSPFSRMEDIASGTSSFLPGR